jgi:hypothetical protein
MAVTIFGTCRLNGINHTNNLNNLINYTHSTKEVLQQIKFLLGEITIPTPFDRLCFRTGICENRSIVYDSNFTNLFSDSTVCIIEICSDKKYMYDNFYLHHLCVDKRFSYYNKNTPTNILDGYKCIKQTYSEIENDILEIKKLLEPRKIVFVTHYNSIMNGNYIESRNNLITVLAEICEKYSIPVIKPSEVLKDYKQEEVMSDDLGHYTQFGISKFTDYLNNYLNNIL